MINIPARYTINTATPASSQRHTTGVRNRLVKRRHPNAKNTNHSSDAVMAPVAKSACWFKGFAAPMEPISTTVSSQANRLITKPGVSGVYGAIQVNWLLAEKLVSTCSGFGLAK